MITDNVISLESPTENKGLLIDLLRSGARDLITNLTVTSRPIDAQLPSRFEGAGFYRETYLARIWKYPIFLSPPSTGSRGLIY